jgi:hypothetical protein
MAIGVIVGLGLIFAVIGVLASTSALTNPKTCDSPEPIR